MTGFRIARLARRVGKEAPVRIRVREIERLATFFLLFWFTSTWVFVFIKPNQFDADATGNLAASLPILRLIWIPIYLLILLLITVRIRFFVPVLLANWLIVGLWALTGASVIWSVSPDDTLRRTIALGLTTFFGLYLGMRWSQKEILQMLAWALAIPMVMSWFVSATMPEMGVMTGSLAGAWRGIFGHKNQLGGLMLLAGAVYITLTYSAERYRWLAALAGLASAALIVLAQSTTALLICVLLLALLFVGRILSLRSRDAVPLIGILLAVGFTFGILGGVFLDSVLLAMGKDATLTGRSEIWARLLGNVAQRPLLGYGYEAFWVKTAQELRSHNGFFDVLLDVGSVGLAMLMASFVITLREGVVLLRAQNSDGYWILLLLGLYFLQNVTESTFMRQNEMLWVLYVAAAARVSLRRQSWPAYIRKAPPSSSLRPPINA